MPRFPSGRLARTAIAVAARLVADGAGVAAAGAGLAAVPALVGADLLAESSRASLKLAHRAAVSGVHAAGTVVTGADPVPGGHLRELGAVVRGLMEPPRARHTPRVWADHGHVQVELPEDGAAPSVRGELRRRLERLDGVQWAAVNDVVGRVLVAFDERRVRTEDIVGVVAGLQRARGGRPQLPPGQDHPADLEPLVAALVSAAVETAAVGVACAAKVLPIPALTRHATVAVVLLDGQPWLRERLTRRIGAFGAGLTFDTVTALLHALTQSPTVPALNAVLEVQQALEARARRQVWCRREAELCGPGQEDAGPALPHPARPPDPRRGPDPARRDPAARPVGGPDQGAQPQGGDLRPGIVRRRTGPAALPARHPADGRLGVTPAGPDRRRRRRRRHPVHRPGRRPRRGRPGWGSCGGLGRRAGVDGGDPVGGRRARRQPRRER